MTPGLALGYSTTVLEIAVIAITLRKRISRLFPIFFAYLIWAVISDVAGFAINPNAINLDSLLYERFFALESSSTP